MKGKRLDVALVEQGYAESRQKAQACIMSGIVYVDGRKIDKSGFAVGDDAKIEVRGKTLKYVSRGGLKLEKAMQTFPIDLNGASKVYAVDVGYGQLDWKIRNDPRVVCMERTNARYLTTEQIPDPLDFVSVDVSFISLGLILPALRPLMKNSGQLVCLVKPQFEAGKEKVGKKGVVRDPAVHREVVERFYAQAEQFDFSVRGMTFSPIRGPEGNIEYLGWLTVGAGRSVPVDFADLVAQSHAALEAKQ